MENKIDLVKQWLNKAEHDLSTAKLALVYEPKLTDSICFHCQQAVEKIFKAYLIFFDIDFVKTHSLPYLLDLIVDRDTKLSDLYDKIEELEGYAVEIRYPDDWCEPTEEEAKAAYDIACKVKARIIKELNL
ncbi:HEPN domain-containing protein [bacterium]|nr:HEPN domain-containing protein [bacterium]